MCSSISQSIPQTKQSPCIFKLVVLACTTRGTDSASIEELMKSIWGLKLAFHVEALNNILIPMYAVREEKFWIAEKFKVHWEKRTRTSNHC